MPYNTISGFPPLPGQAAHGTVYQPKQNFSFLTSQIAKRVPSEQEQDQQRERSRSSSSSSHGAAVEEGSSTLPLIAAAPTTSTNPLTLVHSASARESGVVPEGNAWHKRVRIDELRDQHLTSVSGVACFRPSFITASATAEVSDDTHAARLTPTPLLEPFFNAQELARHGAEETWHTRRLRYLQWLRKGARVAQQTEAVAGEKTEPNYPTIPGDLFATASRAASTGKGGAGVRGAIRPASAHLPPLNQSASGQSGAAVVFEPCEGTRVLDESIPQLLQTGRLEQSSMAGFRSLEFSPNPNEVAVRRLFRQAQGTAFTPLSPSGAAPKTWAGGVVVNEDGDDAHDGSVPKEVGRGEEKRQNSPSASVARPPSSLVQVLLMRDGECYVDEDGFSYNRETGADSSGDDDDSDTASTASHLAVEPPPEYVVASLLRKRMHNTVAAFTASSVHALDAPPRKTTRPFFGRARLQAEEGQDESTRGTATDVSSCTPAPPRTQRPLSSRLVRRLMYKEAYERGLLYQLAFQSSPTRWYSTELPSGENGIAFRKVYAPVMAKDEELQARLDKATAHAIQSIALPRQEAAQATAGRQTHLYTPGHAHGEDRDGRRGLSSPVSGAIALPHAKVPLDNALVTVEIAAQEKEVLFQQWTRLHRNLSDQWQLRQREQAERLSLLGRFVSCAYPEPCICVECDQEVLNMSAIPLEPTVKPLCWYTSVVLSEHHDVLQKELLRRHETGLQIMLAEFRLLFITTYTREKLLEEEERRFTTMLHYHEFCLRVAAQHTPGNARGPTSPVGLHPNESCGSVDDTAVAAPPSRSVQSRADTDQRMQRFRQRRLEAYRAFDSPFFSYLVYTEMITVGAAEEHVRAMLAEEEAVARRELVALMRMDEQFSAFDALERRQRSWIAAEAMEAHSAMLSGPLVQLHAAHMTELREMEAAAYAKVCVREQQTFTSAAFEEKHNIAEMEYTQYKILVREIRQRFLTLLVENRSATGSVEVSRHWLHEQRQSVLVRAEQRLRDQLVLLEEPEAFQAIQQEKKGALLEARESEAQRLAREAAEAEAAERAAAQVKAQESAHAAAQKEAHQAWLAMRDNPELRPSAKLPKDVANNVTKLAMTLNEDFVFFLSPLD